MSYLHGPTVLQTEGRGFKSCCRHQHLAERGGTQEGGPRGNCTVLVQHLTVLPSPIGLGLRDRSHHGCISF